MIIGNLQLPTEWFLVPTTSQAIDEGEVVKNCKETGYNPGNKQERRVKAYRGGHGCCVWQSC